MDSKRTGNFRATSSLGQRVRARERGEGSKLTIDSRRVAGEEDGYAEMVAHRVSWGALPFDVPVYGVNA